VTEPTPDYTASAGRVVFPRSASSLTDTTVCPACSTALRSTVCATCGLDLTHPLATELAAVSFSAAASLDRRVDLIGRIRWETAQARATAAPSASAAPAVVPPTPTFTSPSPTFASPFPTLASPAPALAPPVASPPRFPIAFGDAGPARPRRSSVQVLLLVTGVALLSAYGVFAVATGQLGVVALSIVMVAVTASTYVLASVLRRRGLHSTAEGIAVLAVVLSYLCALAARANDLLGFDLPTITVFWGWVLFVSSALFVVWSRLSHLRSPGLVGVTLFSVGAGLLAGGIPTALETPTRVFVGLLTVLAVGLAHVTTDRVLLAGHTDDTRVPERILAIAPGALSSVFALLTAFLIAPGSTLGPVSALIALGTVALLHVVVALRQAAAQTLPHSVPVAIAASAAAGAAIVFASTGFALALRIDSFSVAQFWPAVLASIVLLIADTLHRRASAAAPKSPLTSTTRAAFWAAALTTLCCLAAPAGVALGLVANPVVLGAAALATAVPGTVVTVDVASYSAATVGASATITILAALVWAITRADIVRRLAAGWMTGATVIVAVTLLETPWLMSLAWFVIAAVTVTLFLRVGAASARRAVRILGLSTVFVSTTAGFFTSWTTPSTWWWGTLVTIALLLTARRMTVSTHGGVRAGLIGVATVVALIAVGSVGRQWGADAPLSLGPPVESLDWLRFTGAIAIVLLAASGAVRTPRFAPLDRRTVFWISFTVSGYTSLMPVFSAVGTAGTPVLPEPFTGLLLALALLGGLLSWVSARVGPGLRPERLAASIALAPAVSWAVFQFARVLQLPTSADVLTPITAALLVSAGALALTTRGALTIPRWAREAGIALVAVPVVLIAIAAPGDYTWLVLLLAAITALMLAVSADGLLVSASPRRHLGWLALTLGTAGLWWRLAEANVTALEPYVLPLASALLLLAFFLERGQRSRGAETAGAMGAAAAGAAPYIALAGLMVAILPIGAVAASGTLVRPLGVGLISAALLFLGTLTTGSAARRRYLDVAAVAGVAGVLVVSLGRAFVITRESVDVSGPVLDAWLGGGFVVLVVAAFGLTRARTDVSRELRATAAQVLGGVALTSLLVLEVANVAATDLGVVRALALILLFCAVYVLAFAVSTAPLTAAIGRLALAYAVVSAGAGLVLADLDPLEMATAPVALALIAVGVLHLQRTPSARSWPTLGPGAAVLLAPSLLATAFEQPMWRLVALGVAAIVLMIVGAVRRLQAPLVLGAVVTLVHVLATFSDEIRAVYESAHWLLWAAIAGVLLIVLAARYEQRVQNLRSIVLRVSALR
jgi:hypothetical protein